MSKLPDNTEYYEAQYDAARGPFCEDRYVPTDKRPSGRDMQYLAVRFAEMAAFVHTHKPGDGYHYLPGPPCAMFNGHNWWPSYADSSGCIFLHARQMCDLLHLDFDKIYHDAYPDEEAPQATDEDREGLERDATLEDAEAVLKDIEQVNYPRLVEILALAWNIVSMQSIPDPYPTTAKGGKV